MVNQTDPLSLETDDLEPQDQATRHEYTAVQHLIGLPSLDSLDSEDERGIVGTIVSHIDRVRGGIANRAKLEKVLFEHYEKERDLEKGARAARNNSSAVSERGMTRAKALLEVIHKEFTERDIRGLVDRLPTSIQPISANGHWRVAGVPLVAGFVPASFTVDIDLKNSFWSSGSRADIASRITNRRSDQVGVRISNAAGVEVVMLLGEPQVNAILGSRMDIVDPTLPNRLLDVTSRLPNRYVRGDVNLPELLRAVPGLANRNRLDWYTDLSANAAAFSRFVTVVDRSTGLQRPGDVTATGEVDVFTRAVFDELNRPHNQPLCARDASLEEAILARAPIDRLLASATDNRELMMALATIQRDPLAARVLQVQNTKTQELLTSRGRLLNERNLSAVIERMTTPQFKTPRRPRAAIDLDITTLRTMAVPVGTAAAGFITARDRSIEQLNAELDLIDQAVDVVNQLAGYVNSSPTLQPLLATGTPPPLAYLNTFLTGGVADETKILNAANGFNPARLGQLVLTVFNGRPGNDKNLSLSTVAQYDQQIQRANDRITAAQAEEQQGGSEMCWAVIKEGLERDGIRGKEQKKVLAALHVELEKTPESIREIETLAKRTFLFDGEKDSEASKHWNEDKASWRKRDIAAVGSGSVASAALLAAGGLAVTTPVGWAMLAGGGLACTSTLLYNKYLKYNAWEEYKKNLFNTGNIAIRPEEKNLRAHSPEKLVDAYFQTKYLYNLPTSDPRHIPQSEEITKFLRRLHLEILNRLSRKFAVSGGISDEALQVLKAEGLHLPKDDSKTTTAERIAAANTFLRSDTYYTAHKQDIEFMADRAYKPVKKQMEKSKWWKEFAKNQGNPFGDIALGRPVTWPKAILYDGLAKGLGWNFLGKTVIVKGGGKVLGGLNNNKGSMAAGAIVGSLILPPLGTFIGAAAGPFIKRLFKGKSPPVH
jgi:hypothetical protein